MRVEKIGLATLYLGDCRDIALKLERPDAVITDQPYGLNYQAFAPRSIGYGIIQNDDGNLNLYFLFTHVSFPQLTIATKNKVLVLRVS